MDYFIIGGDETLFMSNSTGDLRVSGTTDVNKQENNVDDCRRSITIYRNGTTAGSTRTTMFLLYNKSTRQGLNSKFLMQLLVGGPAQ